MVEKSLILVLILFALFQGLWVEAAGYRPELSGRFEVSDRKFTEFEDATDMEVFADYYFFKRFWLRYRQRLNVNDYYFLRIQYEEREYDKEINNNNRSFELSGNYTYNLRDNLRNRWRVILRDRDYINNRSRSYRSYRLRYRVDYEYSSRHDYSIYLQRQFNDYYKGVNDNIRDRISLGWGFAVSDRLDLDTNLQFDRECYEPETGRTNKYDRRLSVNFSYDL